MSAQRVTITYSAPPSFLATDHWKQVHAALLSQLPLRNLHWKSTSRASIRTIQELDVNLVSAEAKRNEATSQIPQTVLEKPLLNAYIVVCDDTETYKSSVRKQIKDWHATVTQRKHQEWLIIHVVRPESRNTGGRIFQVKASVVDKIKADFNVDKRDRCVQLVWSYDYEDPTAWADLIKKVKDGILSAFDAAVTQREEEVKRSEGQRQMPGWNFCTFFILKESLANSFEGMNLHEDALETYEELEALFFQVLSEKNLSWFGTLITPSPKDDSLPLLSITKKSYRDLILANTISVFDFRIYLLARQSGLLSFMGRVVEVARKAVSFLGTFGRRLREIENTLPPYFVESWIYSSALSVVEQCDEWARSFELNKATAASFSAAKGELIELARHQLDIIGIRVGHLPSQPPFSISLPSQCATNGIRPPDRASRQISRADILLSVQDKDAFYETYVNVTNRVIELYANAGRRKFALKMHGDLAALDVHRGRLANALQTFTSLPAHYAPHGWTSLEAYMLSRALDIHASTDKPKDRDWIHVLLDFLKAYVQDLGKELLMTEDDHVAYVTRLVQALRDAAHEAQSDIIQVDHPALSIAIPDGNAKSAETRDGALLEVTVTNALPCTISMDEVVINLSGRDGSRLSFSQKAELLSPGKNTLILFCPCAVYGTYSLHSGQVYMARLSFEWSYAQSAASKNLRFKKPPTLVHIPKDLSALDVRLRQPKRIELGTPSCIIVAFNTGRNDVQSATLQLSAPSGVQFHHQDVTVQGDDDIALETGSHSFVLSDIGADKTVLISVPHSDASAFHAMRVNIEVTYTTSLEPDIKRTLRLVRIVLTALPIAINVEDFFRGTRLFTRFTLSTTSHQHVRIRSAELQSQTPNEDGLKITKSISKSSAITTITPAQPGRFLFQLDSARGQERDPLHLQISYRMLREEVESLIESAVTEVVAASPSLQHQRDVLVDKLVQALESAASWVELYEVTGELVIPNLSTGSGELGKAVTQLKKILSKGKRCGQSIAGWREIVIPVDVPQMHILAAARLRVLPNPFAIETSSARLPALFAGQPISAVLSITTSFHWAPVEDSDSRSYHMRFDIEEMTKDWLVSGRKRGDFVAQDGHTFTTSVTLIALHHGELTLPKVAVSALPIPGERRMKSPVIPSCETYQVHGAETVLVLPRGGRSTFVVSMGESG